MPNPSAQLADLSCLPGVQPSTDQTNYKSDNWVFSDKVRFRNGLAEKIGGWTQIVFDNNAKISGVPRSVWSGTVNQILYTLIGTHSRLYAVIGTALYNITPFTTTAITFGNVESSDYGTLAANPIRTAFNSNVIRVYDPNAGRYRVNDVVTLSGATAVANQAAASINTSHVVRGVFAGAGYWTYFAPINSSTGTSGGGSAVVRSSGLVRVATANTLGEGDRINISGATAFGGLTAPQVNGEFITRNVTGTYFDYMTTGTATSSATGGGAAAQYYPPIPAGQIDESFGQGYGAGRYGVGLYGTALVSSAGKKYPRIWYFDRYGDYMLMSPGNGGGLYQWTGDTTTAPTLVANAPTSINYFFVSDSIIVTFGNGGRENRITTSDQNGMTVWTATAQNQVYDDNIEGAGRLLAHLYVQGINLIFTGSQVYTFQYVGLPNVWRIQLLTNSDGLIGPMAGVSKDGIAYWMGLKNWYQWSGGNVEVMQAANQLRSTILNYVFDNLNFGQNFKCFAWVNPAVEEIRWHYPSNGANDCDRVACTNITEKTWWPDTITRTAAEYPQISLTMPRMIDVSGNFYNHESGNDANGSPLTWTLVSNLQRGAGKYESVLSSFIPDSGQSGSITVQLAVQQWPQSDASLTVKSYTVTPTSGRQEVNQKGRFWQYTIVGSELGQYWQQGGWGQELQQGGDGA